MALDAVALAHRRADRNFHGAQLFDLAAEALPDAALLAVADNLLGFLLRRSGLRNVRENDPYRDL